MPDDEVTGGVREVADRLYALERAGRRAADAIEKFVTAVKEASNGHR